MRAVLHGHRGKRDCPVGRSCSRRYTVQRWYQRYVHRRHLSSQFYLEDITIFFFHNFVKYYLDAYFSNCNRYRRKLAAIGRSIRTLRKTVAESATATGPNARPRAVFTTKMTGQGTRRKSLSPMDRETSKSKRLETAKIILASECPTLTNTFLTVNGK